MIGRITPLLENAEPTVNILEGSLSRDIADRIGADGRSGFDSFLLKLVSVNLCTNHAGN